MDKNTRKSAPTPSSRSRGLRRWSIAFVGVLLTGLLLCGTDLALTGLSFATSQSALRSELAATSSLSIQSQYQPLFKDSSVELRKLVELGAVVRSEEPAQALMKIRQLRFPRSPELAAFEQKLKELTKTEDEAATSSKRVATLGQEEISFNERIREIERELDEVLPPAEATESGTRYQTGVLTGLRVRNGVDPELADEPLRQAVLKQLALKSRDKRKNDDTSARWMNLAQDYRDTQEDLQQVLIEKGRIENVGTSASPDELKAMAQKEFSELALNFATPTTSNALVRTYGRLRNVARRMGFDIPGFRDKVRNGSAVTVVEV